MVGVVVGMATTTFQFAAQSYGMGEINPETNEFEPTGPFAIAMLVVALVNMWINFAASNASTMPIAAGRTDGAGRKAVLMDSSHGRAS